MLTDAERIRLYGSAEAVATADRRIAEEVDAWPPLTPSQQVRLRTLLAPAAPTPARRAEQRGAQSPQTRTAPRARDAAA